MHRQLQSGAAGFDSSTPPIGINQGGHGQNNAIDGVHALGGIHVSELGSPNGLAKLDGQKMLPLSVFQGGATGFFGFGIDGPDYLVAGKTSEFRINDATIRQPPAQVVSVDVGSVVIDGDRLLITAPATGSTLTLSLGVRSVTFQIRPEGIVDQEVFRVMAPLAQAGNVLIQGHPFVVEPMLYTPWEEINGTGQYLTMPNGAVSLEIEGSKGSNGTASIDLETEHGTTTYSLSRVDSYRHIDLPVNPWTIQANQADTGRLRVRFAYSSVVHVSTSWEIARDADFLDIVLSSIDDTLNLTTWPVSLDAGSYFLRYRYNTESSTPPDDPGGPKES